jgi:hypothetical protein
VQDSQRTKDGWATAGAIVVFWPAAFFVGGDKQAAGELALMKGQMVAVEQASNPRDHGGMGEQKITLGSMRAGGVHGLLVYCSDYRCSHHIEISAEPLPDEVRLSDLQPCFVQKASIFLKTQTATSRMRGACCVQGGCNG